MNASNDEGFAQQLLEQRAERYVLKLYVTGMTSRSTEAVAMIRSICHDLLLGRYDLEVVDLYLHPEIAQLKQIIASPTLVKEAPNPRRLMVGNLSDRARVLRGLNLSPAAGLPPAAVA